VIDALVYGGGAVEHYPAADDEQLRAARTAEGTTWVRATGASPAELERVADAFGLHPLTIEDVRNNVRPKAEEFPGYTFLLAKDADLRRGEGSFEEEIDDDAVGVFLGDDWVVTAATAQVAAVGRVWDAVAREDQRLLARGPDFTAYRVIDALVDEYFEVLDSIETQIEAVEEQVLVSTEIDTLERINGVRRDLLAFRKIAWPMREAVNVLARGDPEQVGEVTEKYYRDVYDHLVQAVDLTETYRDLTTGARDIYLNSVSQSTNEVMKTLTVIAVIFLPLTFVAGVFGMNFDPGQPFNMPELGWAFAYPSAMLGMTLVAVILFAYFRRVEYL
jgi:magnesium transporter